MRRYFLTCLLAGSLVCTVTGCSFWDRPLSSEQIARIQLLVPHTKLPYSATNVWFNQDHMMDTIQHVRFDAQIGEARQFCARLMGYELSRGNFSAVPYSKGNLAWWVSELPPSTESAGGIINGYGIEISLVPHGDKATVWMVLYSKP